VHSRWAPQLSAVAARVAHTTAVCNSQLYKNVFQLLEFFQSGLKPAGAGWSGVRFPSRAKNISVHLSSQTASGAHPAPCRMGSIFWRTYVSMEYMFMCMYVLCMNRSGLEADHLPPSSADLSVRGAIFLFYPQDTFTLTFSTAFTNRTVSWTWPHQELYSPCLKQNISGCYSKYFCSVCCLLFITKAEVFLQIWK